MVVDYICRPFGVFTFYFLGVGRWWKVLQIYAFFFFLKVSFVTVSFKKMACHTTFS